MNEPIVMQTCLYVLIMSLEKYECYVTQRYLALLEERHVINNVGMHSSQIREVKYVQLIS